MELTAPVVTRGGTIPDLDIDSIEAKQRGHVILLKGSACVGFLAFVPQLT